MCRPGDLPRIPLPGKLPWWEELGEAPHLEGPVSAYLRRSRWFRGKARSISGVSLSELVRLGDGGEPYPLLFITVRYGEGDPETYQVPALFLEGAEAEHLHAESPRAVIARLTVGDREGLLCDGLHDRGFRDALRAFILGRRDLRGERGGIVSTGHAGEGRGTEGGDARPFPSELFEGEQTNSTIIYGSRDLLKLYRKVEQGANPEVEVARYLTESANFTHSPPFRAAVTLQREGSQPASLALLLGYENNSGDAWRLSQDHLDRCFERILSRRSGIPAASPPGTGFREGSGRGIPERPVGPAGGFSPDLARLLGRRTAELHLALASGGNDPAWRREENTIRSRHALCRSLQSGARRSLRLLRQQREKLSGEERERADRLLAAREEIIARLRLDDDHRNEAANIRIHGDLHLGQVLLTGRDFVFIDFEGEPSRSLRERRRKQSPLRDVAGMIRSCHYASLTALERQEAVNRAYLPLLEPWADRWYRHVTSRFLEGYLERIAGSSLVPADRRVLEQELEAFILDKALYELAYELNNRPDWVGIPLQGIETILRGGRRKTP